MVNLNFAIAYDNCRLASSPRGVPSWCRPPSMLPQMAIASASAYGRVIVAANYQGGIQVLENLARPHWL